MHYSIEVSASIVNQHRNISDLHGLLRLNQRPYQSYYVIITLKIYSNMQKDYSAELIDSVISTASSTSRMHYRSKAQGKSILLDNPTSTKPREKAKINPHRIRNRKLLALPSKETLCSLNKLWISYTTGKLEVNGSSDSNHNVSDSQKTKNDFDNGKKSILTPMKTVANVNILSNVEHLPRLELVGSVLTVTRSKQPSNIGMTGIVIRETQSQLEIVKDGVVKMLSKNANVFTVCIDGVNVIYFGPQLVGRSAERSSKKFKAKCSVDF